MAAKIEKTLVLLKPDAVRRGLIGTIISRFEAAGLKIVALKMIAADKSRIDLHYPINDQDFMTSLGQRGLSNCREAGLDPMTIFGSDDVYRIGQHIQELNSRFLSAGPIVAIVISGPNAIMVVRKLRGSTIPAMADPGTIIGDYSFDSAELAAAQGRSIMNLAHASANPEEASSEIKLWFEVAEIFTYPMPIQDYMIGPS